MPTLLVTKDETINVAAIARLHIDHADPNDFTDDGKRILWAGLNGGNICLFIDSADACRVLKAKITKMMADADLSRGWVVDLDELISSCKAKAAK